MFHSPYVTHPSTVKEGSSSPHPHKHLIFVFEKNYGHSCECEEYLMVLISPMTHGVESQFQNLNSSEADGAVCHRLLEPTLGFKWFRVRGFLYGCSFLQGNCSHAPQQNVGRPNEWDTFQVWTNRPVRLFHFNLLYSKGICWTCWLATSPPCWVRHVPDGGFLGSPLLILLPHFRGLSCLPECSLYSWTALISHS